MRLSPDSSHNLNNIVTTPADFKAHVRSFFLGFGYSLFIKNDRNLHCSCYDPSTELYDTKCPLCMGTGFVPTITKEHFICRNSSREGEALSRLINSIGSADLSIDGSLGYALPELAIHNGDLVVNCDFDKLGFPIKDSMEFYNVNYQEVMQDEHGSKIYAKVGMKRVLTDSKIRSTNLFNKRDEIIFIPSYSQIL